MVRPESLVRRVISNFSGKRTYLFLPPFHRVSEILTSFRALGLVVHFLLVALREAVLFVPQFCVPSRCGHELDLMVDG